MNPFLQQLIKFWNELGINQRVSLIIASAFVVAGMAALVLWSGQPQMVLLYGGLDNKDMAEVVRTLDEGAVKYEIRNGSAIYVPKDTVYQVRMRLAGDGIPNGGGIGFEIFDRTNFGVSDFVQRTNYMRAVQGELQRTIAQLRGVRSARVMIVVPQNRLLVGDEPVRSTASVMIDTGGKVLDSDSVNSVRFLVANSVEGLAVNDVVVVDSNGNPLSQDLNEDGVIGAASGQFKFRRSLEDYFTTKLETMLARVVGQKNVVARVSVELENEALTWTEERFDPESQVVRSQTQTDEVSSSVEGRRQDAVGVAANVPASADGPVRDASQSTSEESRKNRSITYEINRETREVVRGPGSLKKVTAAVFIAKRYTGEGEQRVEQPRSAEEMERLRQVVINALGVDDRNSSPNTPAVTLIEADFAPTEDILPVADAGIQGKVAEWVELLRNFIAVGVAAVMFLIFLRMLKRHRPEPISLEVIEDHGPNRKGPEIAPRLTPELLNELIREKPENVSTALRNWALEAGKK